MSIRDRIMRRVSGGSYTHAEADALSRAAPAGIEVVKTPHGIAYRHRFRGDVSDTTHRTGNYSDGVTEHGVSPGTNGSDQDLTLQEIERQHADRIQKLKDQYK